MHCGVRKVMKRLWQPYSLKRISGSYSNEKRCVIR
jgi:hypothetical protein